MYKAAKTIKKKKKRNYPPPHIILCTSSLVIKGGNQTSSFPVMPDVAGPVLGSAGAGSVPHPQTLTSLWSEKKLADECSRASRTNRNNLSVSCGALWRSKRMCCYDLSSPPAAAGQRGPRQDRSSRLGRGRKDEGSREREIFGLG